MNILSKKNSLLGLSLVVLFALAWLAWSNIRHFQNQTPTTDQTTVLILDWYRHALYADRFTEGFRVPVAARAYAYIGLAAYETALPQLPANYQSLAPLFPELQLPPPPTPAGYHVPASLNACYNAIFQKLFLATPDHVKQDRMALEKKWSDIFAKQVDALTLQRSKTYGEQIARAVYEWSRTDSLGDAGHLYNFDRGYVPPTGEGMWEPCVDFPTPAVLPYWGKTRTFIIDPQKYIASPLPPFSMNPSSLYYAQALEVLTLNTPLSSANQWVAEFWSDDHPSLTFSSGGRWISITNQVVENQAPPVAKVLETYLKLGFALSDAAVACWRSKYHYNLLRPETFIRSAFNSHWRPILHTPAFPAYPSGHAMLSASAAEVLTKLYGSAFDITDRSHEGRTEFKGMPRSYHSFYEMAFESAFSRIALGVHFRIDCEEGTRLGLEIGKEIARLPIHKKNSEL